MKKLIALIVWLALTVSAFAGGYQVKQSTTAYPLVFLMIDSADHISPKTGLSPTVTISKSGGSFNSPSGSVTEIANGWYKVAGNATDSATLGPLVLHATGSGADPVDVLYEVVAFDPQDAVRLGLTALPNAAAEAAGGLYTRGTGAGQINQTANGRVDTNIVSAAGTAWNSGAIGASTVADGTIDAATFAAGAIDAAAIAADAIGASEIAADAIGASEWAAGATTEVQSGLFLAASAPSNFSSLLINGSGHISRVTLADALTANNDKTGYALTQTFPSNFSALAITGGGAVTAGTVSDKTGYSLTQTFPSNFASLGINASGHVSRVTLADALTANNDKTGYSLTQSFPSNFASLLINGSGHVSRVTLADTLTTYTSNTPQTGDSFARLGAPAGASHSADVAAVKSDSAAIKTITDRVNGMIELDGSVYRYTVNSLENAPAGEGGGGGASASAIADAVWDEMRAGHTTSGSFGEGVKIDMTQTVPTTNAPQTNGDALNAARAQGFGKWVINGRTLRLYAADGTTVIHTFTLDSATVPTRRE